MLRAYSGIGSAQAAPGGRVDFRLAKEAAMKPVAPHRRPRARGSAKARTRAASALLSACAAALAASSPADLAAQSLRGGVAAVREQNEQADAHDYTRIRNAAQVRWFVDQGLLVPLEGDANYLLDDEVSFPYARPAVKTFVERLARQYRASCGERLVVTSLTRPTNRQPRNASPRSVHPTGMAVDLRRSSSRACRSWLNAVLLDLERGKLLEATLERRPPHYHIAVYPNPYMSYVGTRLALAADADGAGSTSARYVVRAGDSLWDIARKHGTSVDRLRSVNNIRGSRIYPGQSLALPGPD